MDIFYSIPEFHNETVDSVLFTVGWFSREAGLRFKGACESPPILPSPCGRGRDKPTLFPLAGES